MMSKSAKNRPPGGLSIKNIRTFSRTLNIYASEEDVADKIQAALQELINKSRPDEIKQLANALSGNPQLIKTALHWLPKIK